ncbi:MAG: aldehyde dehydrogenase family protein [Thermoplasmata archaeon YP2-bin.285]|uniref:Aldehyde dehydrogenase family protein n=1 Tax=Candidatus Sysuiplasma superficiale TaxID=2823368 RepID=A0A8J7YLC7_9ARCH|nr:aldehyde dehydrogenase family protein [Candidatus Sysuiplasma superficiale]
MRDTSSSDSRRVLKGLNFIDGEFRQSSNGETINVINPATGKVIGSVPNSTEADLENAVDAARDAFDVGSWSKITPAERSLKLMRVADIIESEIDFFSELESVNSGKSIKQTANYDLPYLIDNIRFLAGASRNLEGKAMAEYGDEGTSAVRREPIGVVGVITPWNYPLMMVVWRAVPALVMGNTVVVKPASYTPLTTIEFAKIVKRAGIPDGAFNVITGRGDRIGNGMAKNSKVDMIAFTGSEEVGRSISAIGAETLKKISLELGGKAPFIVFEDADIKAAVESAVVGGLVNNGQDCANSTRYYVHERLSSNFEIIFKMNGITSYATDPYDLAILSDVEDALSFDPAALSYELYIGGSHEHPRLAELSSLIREGQRYQVPVISHIYPNEEGRDPKAISHCIRLGLELGTDIIKTFYFEGMKQQVLRTPRPVIIAGGAKMSEMSQVVDYVERALGEGAAGIAMGRNLWGWGDRTADLIRRIADMVHSQK